MHACTLNKHTFLYYDIMYHAKTYKSVIPTAIEISSFMHSKKNVKIKLSISCYIPANSKLNYIELSCFTKYSFS